MTYAFDPDLAKIVPLLPTMSMDDVHGARAMLDAMMTARKADFDTGGLRIEDLQVARPDDDADLGIRVYHPTAGATGAGVLYLHGGGFVVGNLESEHGFAMQIAKEVGAVVVSVDYRLAPEHPYPAPLDDCFTAHLWFHQNAASLGVDTDRIAVCGQSAGGGLAAALALLVRDREAPPLVFQFLSIPELDDRLETASMAAFVDTPLFDRPAAEASWRHYLGDESDEVSPYAAPARADDLRGLPPAYISTMEFDPLRDEGIRYGLALLEAGVSCELHSFPRTFHGSAIVASAEVSRRAEAEMFAVLKRQLK